MAFYTNIRNNQDAAGDYTAEVPDVKKMTDDQDEEVKEETDYEDHSGGRDHGGTQRDVL